MPQNGNDQPLILTDDAHATAVQNGIKTPKEVRNAEKLEPLPSGDELLIQGATVPIVTEVGGFDVEAD